MHSNYVIHSIEMSPAVAKAESKLKREHPRGVARILHWRSTEAERRRRKNQGAEGGED